MVESDKLEGDLPRGFETKVKVLFDLHQSAVVQQSPECYSQEGFGEEREVGLNCPWAVFRYC